MPSRMPSNSFFVNFINGRCGSSLLTGYLNQIPDILAYPEILGGLSGEAQSTILDCLVRGGDIETINKHAASTVFFDEPFGDKVKNNFTSIGFKTKYGDIHDLQRFIDFIKDHSFKIVLLRRKDILRSTLSRWRAQIFHAQFGDYNANSVEQEIGASRIDIPAFSDALAIEQRYFDDLNDIVAKTALPGCAFWYEDLITTTATTINIALRALGSAYIIDTIGDRYWVVQRHSKEAVRPLVMKTLKMTSDNIEDNITNYDEFHTYFSKTRYSESLQK